MNIEKYTIDKFEEWDKFVEESINGTIYHTRKFLSYHGEKFEDSSILIYKENELCCVLPACKNGDNFFSHKGATYGGPIFSKDVYNSKDLKSIFNLIFGYYNCIEFRICSDIYHDIKNDILLYFSSNKLKILPELGWYINTDESIINKMNNKRNKKNVVKMMNDKNFSCDIYNDIEDYNLFYDLLSENLETNHKTVPTHTLEEFLILKNILLSKQILYLVKNKDVVYGGVYVIKVTKKCWYTFYISKNIKILKNPSIIWLMETIRIHALNNGVEYLDYGITTENTGSLLNEGLTEFKENSLSGEPSNRYCLLKK